MYTVKQLADLAGVSRRTLHHYDQIGLLRPARLRANGYREYDNAALLRLQQILFYREMGLDLAQIRAVLDDPDFDLVSALQSHRQTLAKKIERLQTLMHTVDTTMTHLIGEVAMSEKKIFAGFSAEQQEKYEQEATEKWGDKVTQSVKLWNSYSDARKKEIMQEGDAIYQGIAANMEKGATSPEVRALLEQWHQHLRYFYEPSIETLGGLGDMYHDSPDFNATFTKINPALPAFLKEAIAIYVDELETQWLERERNILEE